MSRWFLLDQAYHELPDEAALPEGAVEVPGPPGPAQSWDDEAQDWAVDRTVLASMSVPVGHVDQAHVIKAVEASIILSGINLTSGLLVEEAAALGVDVIDLAVEVSRRAAEFRAAEVNRRTIKIRNDTNGG